MTDEISRRIGELLDAYRPWLMAMIQHHIPKGPYSMWDVYQDICVEVLEKLPLYFDPSKGGSLLAFFKQTVVWKILNYKKGLRSRRSKFQTKIQNNESALDTAAREPDIDLILTLKSKARSKIEKEILELLLQGYKKQQIVEQLHISWETLQTTICKFREVINEDVHF